MANIRECPLFNSEQCCGRKHLKELGRVPQVNLKTTDGRELTVPFEAYGETWQSPTGWYSMRFESGELTDFLATEGFNKLDTRSQEIVHSMHPGGTIHTELKPNCPNINPTYYGHQDNPSTPFE